MIKYIALATAAALATCSPAFADDCIPTGDALASLAANGYEPTFSDMSGPYKFVMAENGKGGWVMFAIIGDKACMVVAGSNGEHIPSKPNA